jgi:hypothetical protein
MSGWSRERLDRTLQQRRMQRCAPKTLQNVAFDRNAPGSFTRHSTGENVSGNVSFCFSFAGRPLDLGKPHVVRALKLMQFTNRRDP